MPYFYVPCWPDVKGEEVRKFGDAISDRLRATSRERLQRFVIAISVVERQSIWGYQGDKKQRFFKITMAVPPLVATARNLLEKGEISVPGRGPIRFSTYESNLPFVLRYMVDKDVRGGGWVEVPAGQWYPRPANKKTSHCQLEIDMHWKQLKAHTAEGEWLKLAPLRILSFDIECAGRKGHFPDPKLDPVIQIANVVQIQGNHIIIASFLTRRHGA
jgi:DNA polymerase delta subunit 1